MPTQELLRKLYFYDPVQGALVHQSTHGRAIAGVSIGRGFNPKGYVICRVQHKHLKMHRVVWIYHNGAIPPEMQIDHINRVRTDNRIENLRLATRAQNARNRNRSKNNTSGYTGVYWRANRQRWVVEVRIDGKDRRLGSFKDIRDAITRRKAEELRLGYFPDVTKEKAPVETEADRLAA
jgi:hypothetical protein